MDSHRKCGKDAYQLLEQNHVGNCLGVPPVLPPHNEDLVDHSVCQKAAAKNSTQILTFMLIDWLMYHYPSMNIHGPKKLMDTKNNQNLRRLICSGMIAMSEYFTVTTLKSSLA